MTQKRQVSFMETSIVLFGLSVAMALVSCASAVISHHFSRKTASVQLQSDVEELSFVIEKLLKVQRREKMTNVRAAANDTSKNHASDNRSGESTTVPVRRTRQELRDMFNQKTAGKS